MGLNGYEILLVLSYILGAGATAPMLVYKPWKNHDMLMVMIAFVLSVFWPIMASDILTGEIKR